MSNKIMTSINDVLGDKVVKSLPPAQTEEKEKQEKHLAYKFTEKGNRTMVIGHRGGGFGPENSLMSFEGAIKNGVEGIEFDVSNLPVN